MFYNVEYIRYFLFFQNMSTSHPFSFLKNRFVIIFALLGTFVLVLFLYVLLSGKNNQLQNTATTGTQTILETNINLYMDSLNKSGAILTATDKLVKEGSDLLENGDYSGAVVALIKATGPEMLSSSGTGKPSVQLQTANLLLAESYLQIGNSTYKEKEYAQKALEMLNWLPDYNKSFIGLFQQGYAHEIMKEYDKALEFYQKSDQFTNSNVFKAWVQNQIGHVWDLR